MSSDKVLQAAAPDAVRRTRTISEVAVELGIGRNQAYDLARSGRLRTVKVGSRYVVPASAIEEFLGESQ